MAMDYQYQRILAWCRQRGVKMIFSERGVLPSNRYPRWRTSNGIMVWGACTDLSSHQRGDDCVDIRVDDSHTFEEIELAAAEALLKETRPNCFLRVQFMVETSIDASRLMEKEALEF
jgi:hypothetical protein